MKKTTASLVLGLVLGSSLLAWSVGPAPFQSIFLRDLTASTIVRVDANKETADSSLTDTGSLLTSVSPLILPDGTAANAALANAGDVNTGIWFPSSGRLILESAGSPRVDITGSGVGISGGVLFFASDTTLVREAANGLSQRNTTNAQKFSLYETYTDASNYERYSLTTGSDALILGAETAGTGSDNLSIALAPAGTGTVTVAGNSTQAGIFRISEDTDDGSNYTSFTVPALAANVAYTLPADDGDADEVLKTNGSGVLDWVAAASGTGDITDVWGCSTGDCSALTAASGDSLDATAADSTAPVKDGTAVPGTCAVSELFFDTDESAGANLYGCTSSNTWTLLGDGGGGGGDSVSVNTSAATDADFTDGGGLDWSLNTGTTPDQITAKVKPWEKFTAQQAFLPAASYATHDTRNTHPVLDFDAAADECAYFGGFLSSNYASNGLTVTLAWLATSATTGATGWLVSIEAHPDDALDLDSDSFVADNSASATTASATGEVQYTDITFTDGADMDSLAAGESYRLRVCRDGDGSVVTDDMTGDAELYRVVVRES